MTNQTDNFTQLKQLFDARLSKILEQHSERDERDAIAYILIKLLEGYSVREAGRIFLRASSLVSKVTLVQAIPFDQAE